MGFGLGCEAKPPLVVSKKEEIEVRVCHIELQKEVDAPIVQCGIENNPRLVSFFCDSGAKPNLIKEGVLNMEYHDINKNDILRLVGITSNPVYTKGTVELILNKYKCIFHVVPNTFPIETDALLGRSFFRQTGAVINFATDSLDFKDEKIPFKKGETMLLPARTTTIGYVRIKNNIEEGYLRELKIKKGVYAGKSVVTNKEGKAVLPFHNTTEEDICIVIPAVELEDFDEIENPGAVNDPMGPEEVIFKVKDTKVIKNVINEKEAESKLQENKNKNAAEKISNEEKLDKDQDTKKRSKNESAETNREFSQNYGNCSEC